MAITTVNPRYEGFIFDGENSRDYGIYVQNVKVFGAPTRDVEMISIPGRDGEFALDKGRFNNIQVVYTCAFGTDTKTDFNTGVSDFRNWLASRKGYKRLEDEINTTEYRMAVFKDGLDVSTLNKETGTFEVTFDCKPQRFLKSGETAVTVTSGGTLTNPTLFESHPMLQVWGYGGLEINGEDLEIISAPIGRYKAFSAGVRYASVWRTTIDTTFANSGNEIACIENASYFARFDGSFSCPDRGMVRAVPIGTDLHISIDLSRPISEIYYMATIDRHVFNYGTANTVTASAAIYAHATTTQEYKVADVSFTIAYDGADEILYRMLVTNIHSGCTYSPRMVGVSDLYIDSTKSALGEPIYFDLDIGEAYKVENDVVVSVNNAVTIPAELPTLKPGTNTVTFDNTITQFKIVPRWWKV